VYSSFTSLSFLLSFSFCCSFSLFISFLISFLRLASFFRMIHVQLHIVHSHPSVLSSSAARNTTAGALCILKRKCSGM
jgi:hypothetical protein